MYYNYFNNDQEKLDNIRLFVGQIPIQLFNLPHPQRSNYIPKLFNNNFQIFQINLKLLPIIYLKSFENQNNEFLILSIHINGDIYLTNINGNSIFLYQSNINSNLISIFIQKKLIYYIINESNFLSIVFFKEKLNITTNNTLHINEITCLSSSNNYIVTGSKDTSIILWNYNNNYNIIPLEQLIIHNDTIKCIEISENFGIIVAISLNYLISISKIPNLLLLNSFIIKDLNEYKIQKLIISKFEGLIIILFNSKNSNFKFIIYIYNLNGILISKYYSKELILFIFDIFNYKKFDQLIICFENNLISLFNAFDLKFIRVLYKSENIIEKIDINIKLKLIICYNKNNFFQIIPFIND